MHAKLLFRNDDEIARSRRLWIEDLDRVYDLEDLASGDVIFAATGVTDGSLLRGVKRRRDGVMTTETVVLRASSGTMSWVKGQHRAHGGWVGGRPVKIGRASCRERVCQDV